jgi:hypothetical protein
MLTPLDVAISLKNVETVCKIINKIPKVIIILIGIIEGFHRENFLWSYSMAY